MVPKNLGAFLDTIPEYKRLRKGLEIRGSQYILQSVNEGIPFTLAKLSIDLERPMLILTSKQDEAQRIHENMNFWGAPNTHLLSETEVLPFERVAADTQLEDKRISVLSSLIDAREPISVISSAFAISQKTVLPKEFKQVQTTLIKGGSFKLRSLLDLWSMSGYSVVSIVETPGQISHRGGIVDIFPTNSQFPFRIEFLGDHIETIRKFDPYSQRSIELVKSFTVNTATESLVNKGFIRKLKDLSDSNANSCLSDKDKTRIQEELDLFATNEHSTLRDSLNFYAGFLNEGSLFEYIPKDSLIVVCNPVEFANTVKKSDQRVDDIRKKKESRGQIPDSFPSPYFSWSQVNRKLRRFTDRINIVPWAAFENKTANQFSLPITTSECFFGNLDRVSKRIRELSESGSTVVLITSQEKRVQEVLTDHGLKIYEGPTFNGTILSGSVVMLKSSKIHNAPGLSIKFKNKSLIVFSDVEMFGHIKTRRAYASRTKKIKKSLLRELRPGDYLVHVDHGIAKFAGTHEDPENQNEYLVLRYAAGDRLYVPMESLERVSPYVAPLGRVPHLSRLGSQEWSNTKQKVTDSTKEMASELLTIYATRETVEGYKFSTDTTWQTQLEDSFPYQETDDQVDALLAIKSDMESNKPMDRLICGDVGFGKTELALRAAFKTVMEGKQVAVLAPTTVLVQQHYSTFSRRLAAYPVHIEFLSRFRRHNDQKRVIHNLEQGRVDICIGTHMLIQPNIKFSDLGLVIIDEEQRFGVSQKEQMKKIRAEVDVITLTATPIPRTLHMSMAGIKDISMVSTPPEERIAIKTYVTEFSEDLIKDAILRELDRDGQVYFVHNRIHDISSMAKRLGDIVPEATIAIGHGQLTETELEKTMLNFAEGKIDVLVCTTIIESGLDIQNANTIIINRADTFGLAQLYQLRGRIGRGTKRSYAYLLVPKNAPVNEVASKRLKTMLAATNLGAGFQIAMADLEIRGAGNILGGQQSGHIHAVGYDLYSKMLSEATEQLRASTLNTDDKKSDDHVASIDLGLPANIPSIYIPDLDIRIDIYNEIVRTKNEKDLEEIKDMLKDRFGHIPFQLENLLYISNLRLIARKAGIRSVFKREEKIFLRMNFDLANIKVRLAKQLNKNVEIGNREIRQKITGTESEWTEKLLQLMSTIVDFETEIYRHLQHSGYSQQQPEF